MSRYDDILDLPHHRSKLHPPMPAADRAAQFAPFAALTGYGEAINETARRTDQKICPDESRLDELDEVLAQIELRMREMPAVTVTYFLPDGRKEGGEYVTRTARLKKIDRIGKRLVLEDGTAVDAADILDLIPSAD